MAAETEPLEEQVEAQLPAEPDESAAGCADAAAADGAADDSATAEEGSTGGDGPPTQDTPSEEDTQSVADAPADQVDTDPQGEEESLDQILSLRVPIIVRLAEKQLPLKEILKFNMGTVLQFDKDAYEHVDLMVNNSTIGLGQPVKIGENFGLRIVQIGDINHTIRSLGGAGDAAGG